MTSLKDKSILLIISGGIAAYKSLELIRLIRKSGGHVRCILTKGGAQFVTPLSIAALSEENVYDDLWSLKDETEMGHIRLSREADLIVVAPASANIIAQMAQGLTPDLATTTLLASDKPVLIAPAMNHKMWDHPATQANLATLKDRGVLSVGPDEGDMACGEHGMGRMSEPEAIFEAISDFFFKRPLKGLTALVTSGPTHEPLDPVRFIGNRSSGKQGHAIAAALAQAGAHVTLISGPVNQSAPAGVNLIKVQTAAQMLSACENALPADIAVCAAAVADWAPEQASTQKLKKREDESAPTIALKQNPDILKTLSNHKNRPQMVIGFAAETENLLENAAAKRTRKGCDWILANDVGTDGKTFGADENHVYLVSANGQDDWGLTSKTEIARKLTAQITGYFTDHEHKHAAE
ncbi:MAG: bifunctional phosphopantothenoylcysteine decarboxylase/phosphopantothenate--cysteine ligase CoaBC [Alphaproteobacteria bacterium]|nr:bifunctional phosphopantothenoylcysteine decarboxylase/phosphopantothenate--cysteine ligase CoaBC [Alphaproteobacteria bacterium]